MEETEEYTLRIRKVLMGKVEYFCTPRLISADSAINV
jgi:hypothetical protein